MSVHNPALIRGYLMRKLKELRIFVSMLDPPEMDALRALGPEEGAKTAARIADFVLGQLGHEMPEGKIENGASIRQARKVFGRAHPSGEGGVEP